MGANWCEIDSITYLLSHVPLDLGEWPIGLYGFVMSKKVTVPLLAIY